MTGAGVRRAVGVGAAAVTAACLLAGAQWAPAAFPGDNGRILYLEDGDLWSIEPDGTDPVNVTNHDAFDFQGRYSPDGSKIAFASDRDGDWDIYVMNADGTGEVEQLTDDPAHDQWPAWSPDGSSLAFASTREGGWALYVMNAGGTIWMPLDGGAPGMQPEWSPDGEQIAFVAIRSGDEAEQVYVVPAEGGDATRLTEEGSNQQPTWSPDGTRIAFTHIVDGRYDVWAMDANGENAGAVADDAELHEDNPRWSPDGTALLFTRALAAGGSGLWVSREGDEAALLGDVGINRSAQDWQPTGGECTGDDVTVSSVGGLVEAVQTANATPGCDTIRLEPGAYELTAPLNVTDHLSLLGEPSARITASEGTVIEVRLAENDPTPADLTLRDLHLDGGGVGVSFRGRRLHVEGTTISRAANVGLWFESGDGTVENSTISGNDWGIDNEGGSLVLRHVTITGNADGGLANFAQTHAHNTLIVGNGAGEWGDCERGNPLDSGSGNLDTDGACVAGGEFGGTVDDALLGPLAANGGPTPTHALLDGSPAIDAGNPDACLRTTDQRGIERPQGDGCDVGAFELERGAGGGPLVVNTSDDVGDGSCDAEHCSLRDAISAANAAGGGSIEFAVGDGGRITISVLSPLPPVAGGTTIDGTTQPGDGDGDAPRVVLDGSSAGRTVGLRLEGSGSVVRGLTLNRFASHGIVLDGDGGHVVERSFVGTAATGMAASANGGWGIVVASDGNRVGAHGAWPPNVVSGNALGGILVTGDGNTLLDNRIGSGIDHAAPVGNGGPGVRLADGASGNAVGTSDDGGPGNRIAFNEGAGVVVAGEATTGNRIVRNSIDANGGLGIDLGGDGVSANDPLDGDGGPNRLQNHPVIESAVREASWTRIVGELRSAQGTTYRIDWYVSDACDPSGHGEGASWAGWSQVSTNADGYVAIDTLTGITFPALPGQVVSATATDPAGNTSELAGCVTIGGAKPPYVVTTTADGGAGSLRAAILAANADPDPDRIDFAIPGAGPHTIRPLTPLPAITQPVYVDGYSQPGSAPNTTSPGTNAVLMVEVSNELVDPEAAAGVLTVSGSGSTIRGLVLNRGLYGLVITGETAQGNVVGGNFVGTDVTGTESRTNGIYGVLVRDGASNNTIGGGGLSDRNLISGNVGSAGTNGNGIGIARGASFNDVLNNYVGTDRSGREPLPNATGVLLLSGASGNRIGPSSFDAFNVITENLGEGVRIHEEGTSSNEIRNNFVGVSWISETERKDSGNGGAGVAVSQASHNVVRGNVVANNGGDGVVVGFATGIRISANRIRNNGGLGIDLGGDGVTPNDDGDADTGANGLLNHPELERAAPASGESDQVVVSAALRAGAGTALLRVEWFAGPACDESGHGEGQRYLGAQDVATALAAAGLHRFSSPPLTVAPGEVVTATATDVAGNTSEFSACVTVAGAELSLELEAAETVEAGAGRIRLADVPSWIALGRPADGPQAAPLANVPLANVPLANVDLRRSPLANVPLANVGLGEVVDGPLGDVALSAIPLSTPGGWEAVLAGTIYADVPLQTVTLRDVYSLPVLPAALGDGPGAATLASLDLSHARLASLPLAGVALAGLPLANVPLANVPLANVSVDQTLAAWCAALSGPPLHCTNPASLAGETLLSTSVRGAPLANVPLANVPLANVPLANVPLANVPLANVPLANVPLANVVLGSTPLANVPLANVPLANVPLANVPLAKVPLANVPLANVADCTRVDCANGTLGDAYASDALHPDVTLGDVVGALGDLTLGDLHTFGDVTLADIWDHLPEWVTLGDVLVLLLGPAELPWENLDLDLLDPARYATAGSTLEYAASFTIDGGTASTSATLKVRLPDGFGYVPGTAVLESGETEERPLADPQLDAGALTFAVGGLQRGRAYRLVIRARPSVVLGVATAAATGTAAGGAASAAAHAETEVTETFEPNGDPEAAPEIASDSLYLSYVTSRDDVDYYRFAIPPAGTRVTIRLSQLAADYDVVVYGPGRRELPRDATPAPPLDGVPLADDGAGFGAALQPLAPEALEDVPLLRDRPLWGLSINRGTAREDVVVVSDGEPGYYTIQVSGYNGAQSARPYMLRVQESAPRKLPPCAPREFAHAGDGTAGTLPSTYPAGLNTVFLVNERRLGDTYGTAGAAQVMSALHGNVDELEELGFPAAVVPVEGDPDVAAAYAAWDDEPCSPHRANAVVRAIGDVLDDIRAARPGLTYVVLVGGDDVVPHARIDDVTTFANEVEYAGTFGSVNSQYLGAFGNGKLLTDDPYASTAPIPFFNRQLYVPDLQVGRLVEKPAEIAGAIARFVASDGRLDPQTSFTTGYDFLTDGATEIHDHLSQLVPGASAARIDETWTSGDVEDALFGGTAPRIASINAHYDHHRSLPAAPHAAGSEQGLFTIEEVRSAAPESLAERILFTMGCHAGLSLADGVIANTEPGDWAQAFAEQGALFAGNTGFGLGDTDVVAYTERLLALFAEELRSAGSIAEALARAKHRYLSSQGVVGVYDEKVAAQMTLYGLPMYAVGGGLSAMSAAAADAPATFADPATGIEASSFSVTPTFQTRTRPNGQYDTVQGGDLQVTHFRPIQPRLQLPAQPGARGALVTHLESSDRSGVDPVFSRPIVDDSAREPEISFGDVAFPTKVQTVTRGPDGESLVLVVGQFFTDPAGDVQRRWTRVDGLVYSSASPDYAPPDLRRIDGVRLGSHVSFTVDAADAAGAVKRVYVLYRDATGWHGVDLAHSGSTTFTGGGPVSLGADGRAPEFFVQAVDAAGNVAVSTRKGDYYEARPPDPVDPSLTVELDGPEGNGEWFRGAVSVALAGPTDGALEVSVDGGAFTRYAGAFTVAGDGVHRVEVRGPGGLASSIVVPIDSTPPTIAITTPADGGVYRRGEDVRAAYACVDAGSGAVAFPAASLAVTENDRTPPEAVSTATASYVVSAPPTVTIACPTAVKLGSVATASWTAASAGSGLSTPASGTIVLDTSSVGTKRATTPVARDDYVSEATASCTYSVVFDFSGFLAPVSNPPVVNVVGAGQSVPVKFSLRGDQGLAIFASGFPRSAKVACETGAPTDEVTETLTAGASTLQYDAATDRYTYVWKTDKAWAKTCRRLELRFVDGTTHVAQFRFR